MKRYLRGESGGNAYHWTGLESGAIQIVDVSRDLGYETGRAMAEVLDDVVTRRYNIFSGPLYDTGGVLRCLRGETIHDETLLKDMDWFVKGVEFLDP